MDTIWIWRSGERVEAVHNGHNKITSGCNRYKDIIRSGVGPKMQRKDYNTQHHRPKHATAILARCSFSNKVIHTVYK